MRKADPACKVMGGIAGGPETLTREVIEAGCLKHVDIFNLHIYPGQRPPESYAGEMDDLLALMDAHGGRKPIWMTEFSYYGADNLPRRPFFPRANAWSEERLLDSERQCADYTVRFFLVMLSHGVREGVHPLRRQRAGERPELRVRLFDYGGVPRKLFPALAVMTACWARSRRPSASRRWASSATPSPSRPARQSLVALWSEGDEPGPRVVVPAGEGLRCST